MNTAQKGPKPPIRAWLFQFIAGFLVLGVVVVGAWLARSSAEPPPGPSPEAERVQAAQANMPFQILVPAYLPREFNRDQMQIKADEPGAGGEPMVQLTYRTGDGAALFIREWMPGSPAGEVLANSRPVETKWGQGRLLTQANTAALWTDIGPLRISAYTENLQVIPHELLVQIVDTLGPPSNQQAFYFQVDQPIKNVAPPPPEEIKINADGVQEFTLVVTPGGYNPLRFAVKKGVPVRLIFRQLGEVGCGNELIFPADPENPSALTLKSQADRQVLEFTPRRAGDFEFYCSHQMYRGVMTVRE